VRVSSRGPSLDFRDDEEAEAFAHHLAVMARVTYEARGAAVPRIVRAARDSLNAAGYRASRGQGNTQAKSRRGPPEAALGHDAPCSEQPARLTVSVNEAAMLGEVCPRTVRKWITSREIEAVRGPRGAWRVDLGSLATKIGQRRRDEPDEHEAA
jgi:hypothetical protein